LNFPLYIAKRYIRSKSSQNAVNIINFITFLVIVIGSAALFIVLSGFAGLKTFSLSFTNTFDPDLKAVPLTGKFFAMSPEQQRAIDNLEDIVSYAKEIEERVYLSHDEKSDVAYIKGVDKNYENTIKADSILYFGSWDINEKQGVVGLEIASSLGLTINNYRSPLLVLAPKPGKGSFAQSGFGEKPYNDLPLVVSGIYAVEVNLDGAYIFADLPLVQHLLEKDSTQISGINFKLTPNADIEETKAKLGTILDQNITIKSRQELHSTLHRMLNTENLATYLIFTLVLIIALFNVVGAIIMMILDKQQNSKTLYCLGTTIRELQRIYFVQGVLVTALGGALGVLLGSLLIWSQIAFEWLRITPSLAYPVEYKIVNVGIVLATILVLGIFASKIASSRITKKLLTA